MKQSDSMKLLTDQSHTGGIFGAVLNDFIKGIKRRTDADDEISNEHATANEKNHLEHKSICANHKSNQFQTFGKNITNWMLPIERKP